MHIAPSILSANMAELGKEVTRIEQSQAEYLHLDVMDGLFVPNITFGPDTIQALRANSTLIFDVHLMIVEPERYIRQFVEAGADIISIHVESTPHSHRVIQMIQQYDKKAGIVINPATPVTQIAPLLSMVDLVLVMTVNPGFGGQAFLEDMVDKIKWLDEQRKQHGYHYMIEVDGGITDQTIGSCAKAGADIAVAGSYVFNHKSVVEAVDLLKKAGDVR